MQNTTSNDIVVVVVNVPPTGPRLAAAKGDEVLGGWACLHDVTNVVFGLKEVEEINEKIIESIRLIAFSDCRPVDGSVGELEA